MKECSALADCRQDDYDNIIMKIEGSGKPLILCAHLDTVPVASETSIVPVIEKDRVASNGKTVLGADNKDSIAAILEILRIIKERKFRHRALEIVFTREEEAISKGAQNLDLSLLSGKECIIADFPAPFGTIVTSAPYCFKFETKITGKRCHVKEPEEGVNASLILARAIARLPLGRVNKLTTSNIAYSFSGLKGIVDQKNLAELKKEDRNSVPDFAAVFGEVRGADLKAVEKALQDIKKVFSQDASILGGRARTDIKKLAGGYLFEKDLPLIKHIERIFLTQGIKPNFEGSIGGSDANILNNRGITSVCISAAHKNQHKLSEYLVIDDLVKLTDFYLRLVTEKR
ncbi:MAG: M20/M25/M40 family metallo-hydrolase [Patescibacteria group bacterium]